MSYIRILRDEEHFEALFGEKGLIVSAKKDVLISTANLKMTMIPDSYGTYQSIARLFHNILDKGVTLRVLCSSLSGDVEKRTGFVGALIEQKLLEENHFFLYLFRRNHSKIFVIDKQVGVFGSANLTGAGVGGKVPERRNYEFGAMTDHPVLVGEMLRYVEKAMDEAIRVLSVEDLIKYREMTDGKQSAEGSRKNEAN